MAKSKKAPSAHSRAARRATSPTLEGNIDKSLTDYKPPKPSTKSTTTPTTTNNPYAGITKKSKTTHKRLTRQQRLRREKGVERADAVLDRLAVKVDKSKARASTVQARRKQWEEINGERRRGGGGFVGLDVEGQGDEEDGEEGKGQPVFPVGWVEDEVMDGEEGVEGAGGGGDGDVAGDAPAVKATEEDEDEIL